MIIDKKIPLASMSNHDKNVLHTKLTAKWAFILNSDKQLLPKKITDKEACKWNIYLQSHMQKIPWVAGSYLLVVLYEILYIGGIEK